MTDSKTSTGALSSWERLRGYWQRLPNAVQIVLSALVVGLVGVTVAARFAIDSAYLSGLLFSLDGALLSVPLTVLLVEKLLEVQHQERYKPRRDQALRSLCRDLETAAFAFVSVVPASDQAGYEESFSLVPSEELASVVDKLDKLVNDVYRNDGEIPRLRELHRKAQRPLRRIVDQLTDRLLETGENDKLEKRLLLLDEVWRHWDRAVQTGFGGRRPDLACETLSSIKATHEAAVEAVLEGRNPKPRQPSPHDHGATDWGIGWKYPEPRELPAIWKFVFNNRERRIVLFERGEPWLLHPEAVSELGWADDALIGGVVGGGDGSRASIHFCSAYGSLSPEGQRLLEAFIQRWSRSRRERGS